MEDQRVILIQFGHTIRYYRRQLNISQEEFADRAGFHRTYIGQIERGERNPSLLNIKIICDALHVSLSELLAACEQKLIST